MITRDIYDRRQVPELIFTVDYTVNNSVLYVKGDEYSPYQWNYSRMIDLLERGILIQKT